MEPWEKMLLEMSFKGKIIGERHGASGIVYIVDHGEGHYPRKTAYKTFQERFTLDEEKQRHFLEECIKWFKLKNPYIVTAFYATIISGQPYICMPYCTTDLKTVMLDHKFSLEEALVIITQLVKGLLSIEKKDFSQHQDLNPPNIMLIDLCEKFPGCPTENMLNFQVKVSDFGMIDLYRSLGPIKGAIGGKFAFKAPEQYISEEREKYLGQSFVYHSFKPDTFALGVIIYMLLTGKHPNGLSVDKALNKNTSSSYFKEWALTGPAITLSGDIFESIINDCLLNDPDQRPSLDSILNASLSELKRVAPYAYENLVLRFEQNDNFDSYSPRSDELHALNKIAELPGQRRTILAHLIEINEKLRKSINGPEDVVYYGNTLVQIVGLENTDYKVDTYLVEQAYYLIDLVKTWHRQLKVHHLYPPIKEIGGKTKPVIADMMDFEVVAFLLSISFGILGTHGAEALREYVMALNDPLLVSVYYYYEANKIRLRNGDIIEITHFLDLAREINPEETFFEYIKHLWIRHAEAMSI